MEPKRNEQAARCKNRRNSRKHETRRRVRAAFFVPGRKIQKIGMMNIRLANREKRQSIVDHVVEVSELEICLFVDTGFDKIGNSSMENYLSAMGYNWLSVNKKSRSGGLGFMIKKDIKAEILKQDDFQCPVDKSSEQSPSLSRRSIQTT